MIPKDELENVQKDGLPEKDYPTLGDLEDLKKVDLDNPDEIIQTIYNKELQKNTEVTDRFKDGGTLIKVDIPKDVKTQPAGKTNTSPSGIPQYSVKGNIPGKNVTKVK